MRKISFLHTADVHLGSTLQIKGHSLPAAVERMISQATLIGFKRLCQIAIDEKVDFMVIAGDLYDREARSVQAQQFFVKECDRLEKANIEVFVIAGNHDPLREGWDLFELPKNVKVFAGNQPQIHEFVDEKGIACARLVGQSYLERAEKKAIHLGYNVPDDQLWNLALLHTQLESGNSNYIPCSLSELKETSNFHYWALGHIHKAQTLSENFPLVAYPGIPQGRHFGEQGRGGCILVELKNVNDYSLSFVPTAPVLFQRIDVIIDEDPENVPETLPALTEKFDQAVDKLLSSVTNVTYPVEGFVIEWVLRGRGEIHNKIKEQEEEALDLLVENLRSSYGHGSPFVWTNGIKLRTAGPLDYASLEHGSIVNELDFVIQQCLEDEQTKQELLEALGPIWQGNELTEEHSAIDDFRFHLDRQTLEELLDTARQKILEGLLRGRE